MMGLLGHNFIINQGRSILKDSRKRLAQFDQDLGLLVLAINVIELQKTVGLANTH